MKIAVLINSTKAFGGIGKIAVEQVKSLRELGVDSELLVFCDLDDENRYSEISGNIPIVKLPARIPKWLRINKIIFPFTILNLAHFLYPFILLRHIKRNEWDVIINHESYLTLFLLRLKRKKQIKYVQFVWDPISYIVKRVYNKGILRLFNGLLYLLALKIDYLFLKQAEMVLVGGRAHEQFIRNLGFKCDIVYPSVYAEDRIYGEKEDFVFVITAWKEGKNPEYLLELLEKMPTLKIKMAGIWLDESYRKRFEILVKQKGLNSRLEILGGMSEKQLKGHLLRARVLLQTNDDKGFGMPALEAAGCGCSFIIPEGQGVCDLFENGKDGFFVKERDTERIIFLLNKFLQDRTYAKALGENGWQRAKNNYSWRRHGEKIIDLLKKNKVVCHQ